MTTFFSPAKINISLKVGPKRKDGYHDINTHVQTISLGDLIEFSQGVTDSFSSSSQDIPLDSSNLVIKARDLFRETTSCTHPLNIYLQKKIPAEAGLGGGSSNAATTLWALNKIFKTNLSTSKLQELSARLGSDVPLFFSEGSAICRGRGEIVSAIKNDTKQSLVVVKPSFGLSTQKVYAAFSKLDGDNLKHCENDLELAAFTIDERLLHLKSWLKKLNFKKVLMTGSGSAFYCLADYEITAQTVNLIKNYNGGFWLDVFPACFINRSSSAWYNQTR